MIWVSCWELVGFQGEYSVLHAESERKGSSRFLHPDILIPDFGIIFNKALHKRNAFLILQNCNLNNSNQSRGSFTAAAVILEAFQLFISFAILRSVLLLGAAFEGLTIPAETIDFMAASALIFMYLTFRSGT